MNEILLVLLVTVPASAIFLWIVFGVILFARDITPDSRIWMLNEKVREVVD